MRYTGIMNTHERSAENIEPYLLSMAVVAILGLLAAALAVAGVFFHPLVFLIAIPLLGSSAFFLFRFVTRESWVTRIVLLIAIAVPIIILSGTEPFLFSGRDQGAIAEASVLLAEHGSLRTTSVVSDIFAGIYGPGKALNFPGFHYDASGNLVTQFPIGTISFFGLFASLFGMSGLVPVSGFLLSLSLFSLFVLVRSRSDERFALGAFLVGAVSFLPLFATRLTLSENIFLAFFSALSISIFHFLRLPGRRTFLLPLLFAAFLSLLRIEGIFVFVATILVLILSTPGRHYLTRERSEFLLSTLVISLLFLAINLATGLPLYRSILSATLDHVTGQGAGDSESVFVPLALWKLFVSYGLFVPFLMGILGLIFFTIRRRWTLLIPALLALPAFLFFVDPNVTPDHPWMLRRFLFSLWLVLYFAFPVGLSVILERRWDTLAGRFIIAGIFALAILSSLPATSALLSFREYDGLAEETATLAERIGEHDLLLVDRLATGDPYAIPAAPLRLFHDRHAVYFFNPADYAKIPQGTFEHIYLLAPEDHIDSLWHEIPADLSPVSRVTFSYERFRPTPLRDSAFPEREHLRTESVLYRLDSLPAI